MSKFLFYSIFFFFSINIFADTTSKVKPPVVASNQVSSQVTVMNNKLDSKLIKVLFSEVSYKHFHKYLVLKPFKIESSV